MIQYSIDKVWTCEYSGKQLLQISRFSEKSGEWITLGELTLKESVDLMVETMGGLTQILTDIMSRLPKSMPLEVIEFGTELIKFKYKKNYYRTLYVPHIKGLATNDLREHFLAQEISALVRNYIYERCIGPNK